MSAVTIDLRTVRAALTEWQITPSVEAARRLARFTGPLLEHAELQAERVERLTKMLGVISKGRVGHRLMTVVSRGKHICACACGDYMSPPYATSAEAMEHGSDEHFAALIAALDSTPSEGEPS